MNKLRKAKARRRNKVEIKEYEKKQEERGK
jgi:hypothetical protein